jgi:hypothetical protein
MVRFGDHRFLMDLFGKNDQTGECDDEQHRDYDQQEQQQTAPGGCAAVGACFCKGLGMGADMAAAVGTAVRPGEDPGAADGTFHMVSPRFSIITYFFPGCNEKKIMV